MEKMNVLTLIITLVVGVILTGALLGPVINDTTKTHETFTNTGAFYVELNPTDSYSIEYDQAVDPGKLYVNGEAVPLSFSDSYTVMAIDNAIMRTISDNTIQWKGNGQYITGINKVDLTVANGTVTGTYVGVGGNTVSWPTTTYTECYIASSEEQDLIMSAYNTPVKMMVDSNIHAFGQTLIGSVLYLVKIDGTIEDGVEVKFLNSSNGEELSTVTITDLSINATATAGYVDLYDLSSITFVANDGTTTTNVTYSAYIVPAEVTAELSEHLTPGQISLMGAIPIMVIVALLMAAVGAIALRRAD